MKRYLLVLIISLTSFDKAMERRERYIERDEPVYHLLRNADEQEGCRPCFVKLFKGAMHYANIPVVLILNAGLATAVHKDFIVVPLDRMAEVLLLSLGIKVIDRHMKNIRFIPRISFIILALICGAFGELLDQIILQRNGFRTNIGLLLFLVGISQSLRLGSLERSTESRAPQLRILDAEADVGDHHAAGLAIEEREEIERENAQIRLQWIQRLPEAAVLQLLGHERFTGEIESRVDVSWRRRIEPLVREMIEGILAKRDASRRDRRVFFQEGVSAGILAVSDEPLAAPIPARSPSRPRSASLGRDPKVSPRPFSSDFSDIASIARRGLPDTREDSTRLASFDPLLRANFVVSPGAAGAGGGGSSQLGTPAHVLDSASGDLSAHEGGRSTLLDTYGDDEEAGPADVSARVTSPSLRLKMGLRLLKSKFAKSESVEDQIPPQGELSRTRSLPVLGSRRISPPTNFGQHSQSILPGVITPGDAGAAGAL